MLRNRIVLGVDPFIVLLMVIGGYAVWLFVRLGGAANTTRRENDDGGLQLTGEPREGAGLGLAICGEIVRAHDGEIGVTEGPGGCGSEFSFVLPANTPVMPADPSRR